MIYLVAGLIIGFFVALPVGASAVMCISRSLQYGFLAGLYTGFGVALADLAYGILAVFGLFAISGETLESQPVLRLAGAFCIMFLCLRMMSKIEVTTNKNIDHETVNLQITNNEMLMSIVGEFDQNLKELDFIFLRQDPPFDMSYITSTFLLEYIEDEVKIINKPSEVRNAPEKLFLNRWRDLTPETIITKNISEINSFRKKHK